MASAASAPPPPGNLKRIVAAQPHRHHHRVVRLLPLRLRRRPGLRHRCSSPSRTRSTGTLLSFLTYAIGFAARPIGAVVFGHFGDRLGRKKLLVISLLMMGLSTALIGCVPGYDTIGVAAPLLLTTLRLVQGFALGGEWGGAVLLVSEHGDAEQARLLGLLAAGRRARPATWSPSACSR